MDDIFAHFAEETVQLENLDGSLINGVKALFSGDRQVTVGSVAVPIRAGQRILRTIGGNRTKHYRVREAHLVQACGTFPAHYQLEVEIDLTVPFARRRPARV